MGLIETLLVGSYMYSTGIFLWLQDKVAKLQNNHLAHAEKAINETRERVGLPPVNLTGKR